MGEKESVTTILRELSVTVARIEERQINDEQDRNEMIKILKGNGKPGLVDRVGNLEEHDRTRSAQENEEKDVKKSRDGVKIAIILLAIGEAISLIGGIIAPLLKLP